MRIGIVVDSACDLPVEYYREHALTVLPISIHVNGDTLVDDRDPVAWQRFFDEGFGKHGHSAETEPYSVEQVKALFLGRLVIDYDCVFCLTIASSRSLIHAHTSQASFSILTDYRPIRQAANVPGPFLMRVIDTENMFAAQGVTAVEAVRLRAAGEHPGQMRERLELLSRHTYGYVVPRDLFYLRARTRWRGDRSVGWMTAALGTALDIKPILRGFRGETGPVGKARSFEAATKVLFEYAGRRIRAGLLTPTLCVSYGGELAELAELPGYADLRATCDAERVELFESPMSVTGMINLGAGAVTLGFAAEDHAFDG
ncbi:DegV family protein [Dokdonella sp.]|uniref:DegV family protein n=1 Tax=Dokdonella sp. TaxID=2291710 RepID=UPI0031C4A2D3|nr:DegV family protein [Dokdonella sp.]